AGGRHPRRGYGYRRGAPDPSTPRGDAVNLISPPAPRPPSVLVADRDPDTADSLARLLTTWGHRPVVAYDGPPPWPCTPPTAPAWCSWTSACPAWTGARSPAASAATSRDPGRSSSRSAGTGGRRTAAAAPRRAWTATSSSPPTPPSCGGCWRG